MSRHSTRPAALVLAIASLALLPSCSLMYPEPEPEVEESNYTSSDRNDYLNNAKEYFAGGNYGRARYQLGKYLEQDPSNWMARLHLQFCDYYLGLQSLRAGDLDGGRTRIQSAEAELRGMWNGNLAGSTGDTLGKSQQPWKAAFGIAICQRGLGWADTLEAERRSRMLKSLKRDDPERQEVQGEVIEMRARSGQNYNGAATLLERLVSMKGASPDAIKNLAELRLIQQQDDEAEKQFLRFLKLADETHAMRVKDLEEGGAVDRTFVSQKSRLIAEDLLLQKLASNSNKRVDVLLNLGHLNYQKGDYEKALTFLERAEQITPGRLDILLKKGQCLGENEQYRQAIKQLDEYIQKSSEQEVRFNEAIAQAYRLKASYEHKLKTSGKSDRRP